MRSVIAASLRKERIVIVGGGMAGSKLAYELCQQQNKSTQITLIGEEKQLGYNRIMLSSLLANDITQADMALVDTQKMILSGAEIVSGDPVQGISAEDKSLSLHSGRTLYYDKLILATGSRASILPIQGASAENVIGFRNWQDVQTMSAMAGSQPVSVIGGGLLGLEAAVGLAKRGHQVTVFHRSKYLLNRQLDRESARLLQNKLETMGITFLLGESPQALLHNDQGVVSHIERADGSIMATNLVVMAAGITPEVKVAKQAGLQINRAILVDAQMRTSCPDVFALGECCEFDGQTFGLVAPIWSQINVLLAVLAGKHADFSVAPVPTKLKVSGVNLFSVGRIQPTADDNCIVFQDEGSNHYRKLIVNDGYLVGAILYGNVADGSWYFQLIQNKTNVSDMLDLLVFGEAYCQSKVA
ncbi:NAD(P)/FAD-dependent oxidoreductase [Marinomonas pollencensis]|uniref:Assimilatory nitrate reductase (NADH) beta subunit n=1 Tax=Marinomonas pollencensis TaxID=491954 RepID=A0A3E0DPP9_9GAMM|nr:FAD-dependent oxidoreductase [Marinomonas pollencensis]REG84165.1 assimilatory nitrate reductase (NADH) beta subunit [Marinomonas pollencensis]